MTDKLSPCPFCGAAAERLDLTDGDNAGGSVIGCTKCEASTRVFFGEKEGLVEAWNDRPKGLRAGLRDALDTAICCLHLPGCSVPLEMVLFGNQTDAIVDAALAAISPRITELLEANNRMEAEARAARADTRRWRDMTFTLTQLHTVSIETFQDRADGWMLVCFGEAVARDRTRRAHRFLEEALELAQALDCTSADAYELVDYVFGRPAGAPTQEVGGVMLTLAGLSTAAGISMTSAGEAELARVWTKIDQIRAKDATKPHNSPLPGTAAEEVSHG